MNESAEVTCWGGGPDFRNLKNKRSHDHFVPCRPKRTIPPANIMFCREKKKESMATLLPMCQPSGDDLLRVTNVKAVGNLRGYRKPPYALPRGAKYYYAKMKGGPHARPNRKMIARVCDWILSFTSGTVVIHCEHGLNRTGVVFCQSLMVRDGISCDDAMSMFEALRPPGIQRTWCRRYLRSLTTESNSEA